MHGPWRPEEGVRSRGIGIRHNFEPPYDNGNEIKNPCKGSNCYSSMPE